MALLQMSKTTNVRFSVKNQWFEVARYAVKERFDLSIVISL